jgi:DNA-binding FrmR family transcriptional regulator
MKADENVLKLVDSTFVPAERKGELRSRLRRIRGQVDGLERMLDGNRPCLELLTQTASAQEALRGVARLMTRNYLERCAADAIRAGREQEVYDKLLEVIFKLNR